MANEVKIEDHTEELLQDLEFKKEKALTLVGLEAEGDAKIEIESDPRRVDTGRLRNSITWATMKEHDDPKYEGGDGDEVDPDSGVTSAQAEPDAVVIGTNVEYAYEVHEGDPSRKLAPNRFLRNAVERNMEKYRKIIDDTMKQD